VLLLLLLLISLKDYIHIRIHIIVDSPLLVVTAVGHHHGRGLS